MSECDIITGITKFRETRNFCLQLQENYGSLIKTEIPDEGVVSSVS